MTEFNWLQKKRPPQSNFGLSGVSLLAVILLHYTPVAVPAPCSLYYHLSLATFGNVSQSRVQLVLIQSVAICNIYIDLKGVQ